ncbi:MAG: hypothetical protein ACPLKS_04715 [Caldisericum exile]|uniref:hypothetical protein n=1 Tax=Caldisericum exile TaxID=693075 RepID=UPI003C73A709
MEKRNMNRKIDMPEALDARILELSRRNSVPVERLLRELEEIKKTIPNSRLAVNALMNRYRRQTQFQQRMNTKQKAELLSGFLIGDMGLVDRAEQIRRKAKSYIEEHGVQAAIEAQLINESGEVLDTREKIYGRDNPKYLEPLDPNLHIRSRTLIGFFRRNGDAEYKYTTVHTEDNGLAKAWDKVKFYMPCTTYGIVREDSNGEMKVNSSSSKETLTVFKASRDEIDIDKVVMEYVNKNLTRISDIEMLHEQLKDAWDRKIVVRGIVSWINIDRPTPFGSVWMGLMDSEDETVTVRCLIPDHLTIDFSENSEIVVFGRTRRNKTRDEDGDLIDADVIIDVHAIYPLPGLVIPRDAVESTRQSNEELEIDGWIE